MSTYPNLKNDPELLEIKTRDDEIKNLKYQSEKNDHQNILKIFIGSGSAVGNSATGLINPGVGIIISSSTALLTSIAILITNEYISKIKIRYRKLRYWINVNTLLYEKTLKTSMIDKKN